MKLINHYFPFFILTALLYGLFFYTYQQPTVIVPELNSGQQAVQLQFIEFTAKAEQQTAAEPPKEEAKALPEKPPAAEPQTTVSDSSKIKIAKQKLQESIRKTPASDDAQLKAELYSPEHKPLTAMAEKVPAIKKQPPQEVQKNTLKQQPKNTKPVIKKQPSASSSVKNQGVLQEAIVVSGNIPVYPKRAILRNQQGRVVVKLTVSSRGEGTDPHIISSSGYSILDNAVIAFIGKELFMPALRGDKKVASEQIFSFRFELH